MSCHRIGHALNDIEKTILALMDGNHISREVACTLLLSCQEAMGWCDGNPSELTDALDAQYCGDCLVKLPDDAVMYNIWYAGIDSNKIHQYREAHNLVGNYMCDACFTQMCKELGLTEQEIQNQKIHQITTDSCQYAGIHNRARLIL